jgi:formylglycine-generating enzyme required for sulfatase activity
MKRHKWMIIAAMVACVLIASPVLAGSLTPPGAPGPTMHTLEEIYQRQAAIEARLQAAGMAEVPAGMVLIPAGAFVMGATTNVGHESYSDEKPQHTVSVSAFYMDETEVTKAQWDGVYTWATNNGYAFDNTGLGKAATHPVHMVNWYDCVKWANARSEMAGLTACYTTDGEVCRTNAATPVCDWLANGCRLPTEAEWEKAARGGAANRRFPWSDTSTIQHARENYYSSTDDAYDTSPTRDYHPDYNSGDTPYTSPGGSFAPNGYGVYDMAGNLLEWCWDQYGSTYYSSSPIADPRGSGSGSIRVRRGGRWDDYADTCRVANRGSASPSSKSNFLGFRLVRAAP